MFLSRLTRIPFRPSVFFNHTMSVRPYDWKSIAPSVPFPTQSSLPSLPVADLQGTLAKLKESLRPLAWTDDEYADAATKIDQFAKSTQAADLYARIVERASQSKHWLEEWWDDAAYLSYRDSIVVNVSYYYGFTHVPQSPAARAASIVRAVTFFRQQLKRGFIKPDGANTVPFCMDTYRWMFDCCRVPGPQGLDWSVSYATPDDLGNSAHIVVFRNNRPWKLDVTMDGRILSTTELTKQFQYIYHNSGDVHPGVGVLPASNRDVWAKDYAQLVSSEHNAQIMRTIHSAAFTVSLDTSTPTDPVSFSRHLWHGQLASQTPLGLQNRWVDKPTQFIIFDNAQAGIMGEHSVMDGTPTARMCDEILDYLQNPAFDHGLSSPTSPPTPTPMDWHVSPTIAKAISTANQAAVDLIEGQSLGYVLTAYGKSTIKKFNVSPDSWAQMLIQLAYTRLLASQNQKRLGGTYEAATTRRFYKGRTEAIRVVSVESDRWAKSMDDDNVGLVERKRLFGEAVKKHLALAKGGGMGIGVDRLMFGLKKALRKGEDVPAIFTDPLIARSSYWVLSTSSIFSKHFPAYGWGEVVPEGFGVAYMTGYDDRLQFTITSRKELPNDRFCKEISKAAVDLYDLYSRSAERATL